MGRVTVVLLFVLLCGPLLCLGNHHTVSHQHRGDQSATVRERTEDDRHREHGRDDVAMMRKEQPIMDAEETTHEPEHEEAAHEPAEGEQAGEPAGEHGGEPAEGEHGGEEGHTGEGEQEGGEGEGEKEAGAEEEEEPDAQLLNDATLVIVTILITLSVCFDLVRERLNDSTTKNMVPVLQHLWEELTVLGFLSLLSFLIVESGELQKYSQEYFGEEETLVELMEYIHMLLFFIMIIFMVQVWLVIQLGKNVEKKWLEVDDEARLNPEKIADEYREGLANPAQANRTQSERMDFLVLRYNFLEGQHVKELHAPARDNFALGEYFSYILGETLGELVEIPPPAWIALWLVFGGMWIAASLEDRVQHHAAWAFGFISFVVFGFLLLLICVLVSRRLDWIFAQLLPPHAKALRLVNERKEQQLRKSSQTVRGTPRPSPKSTMTYAEAARKGNAAEAKEEETPLLNEFSPSYLRNPFDPFVHFPGGVKPEGGTHRTGWRAWLYGRRIPNRHELLYWFEVNGPAFLINITRLILLLNSIFVAMFVVHFVRELFVKLHPLLAGAATIVALLPCLLMFAIYLPHIVERAVVCGNIEQLQNREFIEKTARVMATRRSLSVLKLIKLLRFKGQQKKHKAKAGGDNKAKTLTLEQKNQIAEAFRLFDKDGNQRISADELAAMMTLLGHQTTLEEAQEIISSGDGAGDKDGVWDQQEFEQFMANRFTEEPESVEELVDGLFAMFDQGPKESGDEDAKIDSKEFKTLLKKLGSTLRDEDIDAVVREIDKDGDGSFDKEEFKHMLVHYAKIAAA